MTRDGFTVSTDPARLDLGLIHETLSTESYWAQTRPRDKATFAYLSDVFGLAPYRGKGLSKFLIGAIMAHPRQGLRRWTLFTCDAHRLYEQFGFIGLVDPDRAMEKKVI